MGIFKKSKKEEKTNITPDVKEQTKKIEENKNENLQPEMQTITKEQKNKENEVEIIELDEKKEKIENTLDSRKENRIIFGIIGLLIIFAFFLPTITGIISRNSIFTYSKNIDEIVNKKTVDGMLEIGKDEGTITAKDIRFYNPTKKSKNEIHIVYLPEKGINNVNNLKMYVEFYNSKKTIIYRYPFMSDETLERKIQKTYKLKLNEKLYSEATYAKVSIIKDEEFNKTTDTLVCTNNFEDGSFYVSQKITYNFSDKGLINYQVSRKAEKQKESNPELEEDSAKYTKICKRNNL